MAGYIGKKYKMGKQENVEELMLALGLSADKIKQFTEARPTHWLEKSGDGKYELVADWGNGKITKNAFELGVEFEEVREDGIKLVHLVTFEGDNTVNQVEKLPDGKVVHMKRVYSQKCVHLTATLEGSDIVCKCHYEYV